MRAEDDSDMLRYLSIVDELIEKGYDPRYIAAVLLRSKLPLTDSEDLNVDFNNSRKRRNRKDGKERKGKRNHFGPEKTKRIFISVGTKDGAKKRDVLGAICGEAGIPSSSVGDIDMYSKFTFVDIADDVAQKVEKKLTGKTIKGRKVKAEISKKKKHK